MAFQIVPAIDIKGGRCVRLTQGLFTEVDTYSDDPLEFAEKWESLGAERLHLVDLDGAKDGAPQNGEVIERIVKSLKIPVQVGGGIRSLDTAKRLLDGGVDRVIFGTSVARNEALAREVLSVLGERAILGIDAKAGLVAVSGWQETTGEAATDFARRMVDAGARRIIFTDIGRDGMLTGVNREALVEMLEAVEIPVIASGGVGSIDDIHLLRGVPHPNLEGVIIGKALYAGKLDLSEALALAKGGDQES